MVELQKGKELVPQSQLEDLILLIHQGIQGWEAESGAIGSVAQRQCLRNCQHQCTGSQHFAHNPFHRRAWWATGAGRRRASVIASAQMRPVRTRLEKFLSFREAFRCPRIIPPHFVNYAQGAPLSVSTMLSDSAQFADGRQKQKNP